MRKYIVTLIQKSANKDLDPMDVAQFGKHGKNKVAYTWKCEAPNSDAAIDKFHLLVPVACVDNYEWDAGRDRGPTNGSVQLHGYVVHHKHGEDVLLGSTPDEAKQYLYDYICTWWGDLDFEAGEESISEKPPEDMDQAIERYFDSEHGAHEEYAEQTSTDIDPTHGMEAFITSDQFDEKHTLNIRFTQEGMIFDYVDNKGEVVKTMSKMYGEIVEDWLK